MNTPNLHHAHTRSHTVNNETIPLLATKHVHIALRFLKK